jgi:hypothetical protein
MIKIKITFDKNLPKKCSMETKISVSKYFLNATIVYIVSQFITNIIKVVKNVNVKIL